MPRGRVLLVRAALPGETRTDGPPARSVGSATLLAGRLVLTAAHMVFADGGAPLTGVSVEIADGRRVDARVVWPDRWVRDPVPGRGLDVALLEVSDPGWLAPAGVRGPVRLGRLTGRAGGIGCEAIGFPRVLRDPDGIRLEDQISATINPDTARSAPGGRYDLHVTSSPPAPVGPDAPSPWSGASGPACSPAECLTTGDVVTLDGTGSYDPNGTVTTYA